MCGEKGRRAPGMLLRGPTRAGDRGDGSATALACTTPPGMAAGGFIAGFGASLLCV